MGLSPQQIHRSAALRQGLLQAAARLIARAGAQALTLDAVAREAGTSKGGLLHHFRCKTDLLRAVMQDLLDRFEADLRRLAEADPDPRGRCMRAYINASAASAPDEGRLGMAVMTALLFDPTLMRQWQDSVRDWLAGDSADPVQAGILRLAADGLWASEAFGLHPMTPEQRDAIVQRLIAMTRP
ncbi:MAG: TetR/AcrR family transcriptional regulator [Methylobacterium frigidaeris]